MWSSRVQELGLKHLLVKLDDFKTNATHQIRMRNVEVTSQYTLYRTKGFNVISHSKLRVVSELMKRCPEIDRVWFSDVDVYFLHMVTAGAPRLSYVVRLLRRGRCVSISRRSIAEGEARSDACSAFRRVADVLPASDAAVDAAAVDWASVAGA